MPLIVLVLALVLLLILVPVDCIFFYVFPFWVDYDRFVLGVDCLLFYGLHAFLVDCLGFFFRLLCFVGGVYSFFGGLYSLVDGLHSAFLLY